MEALTSRARLLALIRDFFAQRSVLEVETPLLSAGTVTDPNIEPMAVGERWLQTSPEYAMKRLLAADSGPIYQICKAFRAGEAGPRHNPEFSLLEWYRPGFTLQQLMAEVADLVNSILPRTNWHNFTYRQLFQKFLDIDPFDSDVRALRALSLQHIDLGFDEADRDVWLDLLLTHLIEPQLVELGAVFVQDYPASQAALARLRQDGEDLVAQRFELYIDGLELANGYLELTDASELAQRFATDNRQLQSRGSAMRPVDERLLQAMQAGLPDCSGVALGVDRLLMLQLTATGLGDVLSFDWHRA
jgi:lysyl-tRNA synthetase class 2